MRLLLVHGMGRTPLSLARLARFLRREGHDVERLGYVAAVESFEEFFARLPRPTVPYTIIAGNAGPRESGAPSPPTTMTGW